MFPENLPVEFGGTFQCEGGCEFSEIGPWQEPEWAHMPTWAEPKVHKYVGQDEDAGFEKKTEGEEDTQPSAKCL